MVCLYIICILPAYCLFVSVYNLYIFIDIFQWQEPIFLCVSTYLANKADFDSKMD